MKVSSSSHPIIRNWYKSIYTRNHQNNGTLSTVKLNSIHVNSSDPSSVNKTLVVLHGLFGSAVNWLDIAEDMQIKSKRQSVLVDLRNHGDSSHANTMTYNEMADDVIYHLNKQNIQRFTIIGHSFGSKVAMTIACKLGNRVDGLIIVDSAPYDNKDIKQIYNASKNVIETLLKYDLTGKKKEEVMEGLYKILVFVSLLITVCTCCQVT